MSKPDWMEAGTLGAVAWKVDQRGPQVSVRVEADNAEGFVLSAWPAGPRELRDFARALHRAADALEAAAKPEPKHWLGPGFACGICGLPWPCADYTLEAAAPPAEATLEDRLRALERRVSALDDPFAPPLRPHRP